MNKPTKANEPNQYFTCTPDLDGFSKLYERGVAQVVWTRRVADLETPVSAMLKLGEREENCFLLESVEGGAVRGRYSVIGLRPDVIWRAEGSKAEINRGALLPESTFEALPGNTLEALRNFLAESHIDLPEELPPMAAGVFGYMGYDTVRLIERLPGAGEDVLEVPDGILIRPTVMVIFDSVKDEMVIVTPVRPDPPGPDTEQEGPYFSALRRLEQVVKKLDGPLPRQRKRRATPNRLFGDARSNTPREDYLAMVRKAKDYITAGDIFQVVLSQRFSTPFKLPAFMLYRALRRTNPSPFLFYLNFAGFSIVGSSPEILVRVRDGEVTVRPIAGTRPRGATAKEDQALAADLLADNKRTRGAPDAARPWAQ